MHNLDRARQAWIIARIELRRAFVSRRAFWVYGLALLPSLIFLGGSLQARLRESRLSAGGLTPAYLIDGLREGQTPAEVLERLGRPVYDRQWATSRRVREASERDGVTRHPIEPAVEARYVRLNVLQPATAATGRRGSTNSRSTAAARKTWPWCARRPPAPPAAPGKARKRRSTAASREARPIAGAPGGGVPICRSTSARRARSGAW